MREVDFSEITQNKDYRIDSQFYTKNLIKNTKLKYKKIGDLIHTSQYGISISMNEEGLGSPIYRMNEIHNMFCDIEVAKHAEITQSELVTFKLNDRDVLFNRTNSFEWVGRTGLYRKLDNKDFIFASYLVRFTPNQELLLPEYLVAFLNSKYGVLDIKRRARQSINQTNVNPEEVKEIEIPLLSTLYQEKIKENFDTAFKYLEKSKLLYTQAEDLLLAEVGLKDFSPSTEAVNIKSFSESFGTSGRLDAEYYQPKYEQVINKIKQQHYDNLKNLLSIKKSIEPGSNNYADEGLPFLRVADFSKQGFTEPQKYLTSHFIEENKKTITSLKPKKNTILFSKDGSVGMAYQLREDFNGITSGAILHLKIKDSEKLLPEYLTLVLNSELVQLQAQRDVGGSIILHWRVSEIEEVIVPIIPLEKQQQIAQLVEQSFALRAQSEQLLEVAKRAVEIAIEEDENVAMAYIKKEVGENE